jgi:RNA-binding protein PNO1
MTDQDDELLLDAPDVVPSELNAAQLAEGDTDMTVDLDGRPRFAPAKNTVCILPKILLYFLSL